MFYNQYEEYQEGVFLEKHTSTGDPFQDYVEFCKKLPPKDQLRLNNIVLQWGKEVKRAGWSDGVFVGVIVGVLFAVLLLITLMQFDLV